MSSIAAGSTVEVNKDIVRIEGPYAKAGEVGIVIEMFVPRCSKSKRVLHAKVLMSENVVKTFRVTSLKKRED